MVKEQTFLAVFKERITLSLSGDELPKDEEGRE